MQHAHTLQPYAEPIFWIAAALCFVAQVAILRSAFTPPHIADNSGTIPHSSRAAEMVWAVIPAIGLVVLLAATWRAIH